MTLVYGTVCSGIEAPSVAWAPLGWRAAWFSEIAPFPSAVLAARFPHVPNLGDMTALADRSDLEPIDLLMGGTPCQDFSVAGLRAGLAGARSGLALEFFRIAARTRPRWVVWENVPGVLSSGGGRDFGAILGALAELGYGWAYRILDAQHFGVPQRRRRVFVVGYSGDWRRAAAVLFERHSLSWDPPPRRSKGARVAGTLGGRSPGAGWRVGADEATRALRGKSNLSHREDMDTLVAHSLRGTGFDASEDGTGRGTPLVPVAFHMIQDPISGEASPALGRKSMGMGVAVANLAQITSGCNRATVRPGDPCPPLDATGAAALVTPMAVRRLLPVECERLMGLPDDYTLIDYHGKPASAGPRYEALGNAIAVPVIAWIGRRIAAVEALAGTAPRDALGTEVSG